MSQTLGHYSCCAIGNDHAGSKSSRRHEDFCRVDGQANVICGLGGFKMWLMAFSVSIALVGSMLVTAAGREIPAGMVLAVMLNSTRDAVRLERSRFASACRSHSPLSAFCERSFG
jgi:hypothetical protein